MPPQDAAPVPVTVLTGALGAGKTTLLKYILTQDHGRRIAVIENEFGDIGIDHELVFDTEQEIFVANNGCLCCTVRGDLLRILDQLMARRHAFDYILIETTGLAAPGPVAQTFLMDEGLAARLRLDGFVTLVDAEYLPRQLKDSPQTAEQIAFADVLLLNKADRVDAAALATVQGQVRGINPTAPLLTTCNAAVDLAHILDLGAFGPEGARRLDPDFAVDAAGHHEHGEVGSVGLRLPGALDPARFEIWLATLLMEKGPAIFRTKGVLHFAGQERRIVVQGVYFHVECDEADFWGDRPRLNELVFIGRDLQRAEISAGFAACLA